LVLYFGNIDVCITRSSARDTMKISPEPYTADLYKLVRKNMKGMYEGSGMGWNRVDKIDEMEDEELAYHVARENGEMLGFVSFMHTVEDDVEVVYLYELQVAKGRQGHGVGKELMRVVIDEARACGRPIMLTVFLMNERAIGFYRRYGFERVGRGPQEGKRVRGWMQMRRDTRSD
jgi:ribosomal protein S18 acetylase RimI-like enzyme